MVLANPTHEEICMKQTNKIRKCPECAELVHFEGGVTWMRCWQCCAEVDWSRTRHASEKQVLWLRRRFDGCLPNPSALTRVAKTGLVLALPVSVFMVLGNNSLDVYPEHSLLMPPPVGQQWAFDCFGEMPRHLMK
jgi:hypothetical protein